MRGQTLEARQHRLSEQCCPIHGLPMYQIAGWGLNEHGVLDSDNYGPYTMIGCTRKDCKVAVLVTSYEDTNGIVLRH